MTLYLEIGRPWGSLMVRRGSRVRVPSSALFLYRHLTSSSIHFLSKVVLFCPSDEGNESSAQESNMALYLAIGRPCGSQHGKDEVSGSTPDVGSFCTASSPAVRYTFCPRLARTGSRHGSR
jgi:hypothetical protein